MHNMTRVSTKGIVQLEERQEELPHWVLSAMKCLANWPKQLRSVRNNSVHLPSAAVFQNNDAEYVLRTQNGKESCLPSYPGFEQDVFNVVRRKISS